MLLLEMALAFAITFILYLLLKKTAGKLYRSYLLWEKLHEEEERPRSPSKNKEEDEEEGRKGEGYGQDR